MKLPENFEFAQSWTSGKEDNLAIVIAWLFSFSSFINPNDSSWLMMTQATFNDALYTLFNLEYLSLIVPRWKWFIKVTLEIQNKFTLMMIVGGNSLSLIRKLSIYKSTRAVLSAFVRHRERVDNRISESKSIDWHSRKAICNAPPKINLSRSSLLRGEKQFSFCLYLVDVLRHIAVSP